MSTLPPLELVAAKVHAAWVDAKRAAGIESRPSADGREQMVPYEQLDDDLQELDRATVRAVYAAISNAQPAAQTDAAVTGWLSRTKRQVQDAERAFPGETHDYLWRYTHGARDLEDAEREPAFEVVRLYTHAAPAPTVVPLTVGQAFDLWDHAQGEIGSSIINFARAIERRCGITAAKE